MKKNKIAENIYQYYKKMLNLKRKILLHEGNYITLDEFVEQISNQKRGSDFNNAYKVLLSNEEIEELCLLAKEGVLSSNKFIEHSGRDFHIIRDFLMNSRNSMSDKIRCFYLNDTNCGIDSSFSMLAGSKTDEITIGPCNFSNDIDFSFIDNKCMFIEDLYVIDIESLKDAIEIERYQEVLDIVNCKFLSGIYSDSFRKPYITSLPRIVLVSNKENYGNLGIYNFNEERERFFSNQIHFVKDVSIKDMSLFKPLKEETKKYDFNVKGYFTEESLNNVLLAMDRYKDLNEVEKEKFDAAVDYSVNKIMNYLKNDNIDLNDYNRMEYLMFAKKNGVFTEEQISKFKTYIEAMIRIQTLSHNYYELSNDHLLHGLYFSAADYAGMNLVYFPKIFLKCGMTYVQDGQDIVHFDSLTKNK